MLSNIFSHLKRINLLVLVLSAFLGFSTLKSSAQENINTPYQIDKFGIGLQIGGANVPGGLSLDYMFTNRIALEMGFGFNQTLGLKIFITDPAKHRFNLYTGVVFSTTNLHKDLDSNGLESMSYGTNGKSLYVPIGVSYFGKKHFQYAFDVGVHMDEDVITPIFSLKVGYRFFIDTKKIKKTPKTEKKNILSGSILGITPLIGVTYERLITPNFGIEAGIGLPSAGLGVKYYFPKIRENKMGFHIGASHHFFVFPWAGGWKTYFPIGINRMSESGFRISFDIGPKIEWWENIGSNYDWFLTTNLRIGKAF